MIPPTYLRTEEPEFEQLVHQALRRADIRHAIRQVPGELTLGHLRDRAMEKRHIIAAAAATEYQAHLERRGAAGAGSWKGHAEGTASADGHGCLAAVVVLTPIPSSAAAAFFLVLGYGISLSSAQGTLADALIGAGHTAVIAASISIAIGVACLLLTVARHHSSPPGSTWDREAELRRLHESWRQALLTRGILPFLRDQLRLPHSTLAPEPTEYSRTAHPGPGPTGPGYSSPGFSGPRHPTPSA
ncbi:hypothetical protein V1L54_24585 [Streptomyces sp. TRM 70361]|uniref:hypothetical protein n=1 Tax=Streptomyces sp. TRM 70361 TaxID=3116553 RepID=UPI002E7AAF42|nr:hypothetical protein [Streptomyces sp. TRM 70361]MEE1942541.1 hypothetical protein [Streptomyces sp. TRM 70361]